MSPPFLLSLQNIQHTLKKCMKKIKSCRENKIGRKTILWHFFMPLPSRCENIKNVHKVGGLREGEGEEKCRRREKWVFFASFIRIKVHRTQKKMRYFSLIVLFCIILKWNNGIRKTFFILWQKRCDIKKSLSYLGRSLSPSLSMCLQKNTFLRVDKDAILFLLWYSFFFFFSFNANAFARRFSNAPPPSSSISSIYSLALWCGCGLWVPLFRIGIDALSVLKSDLPTTVSILHE